MPNTTYGSPYAQSSDLVSNWPGVSQNVADRLDDVSFKGNGLNDQTGTTYTLVLTDAGKTVTLNNASAVTVTVPTNASVAFETGTQIEFTNKGAGVVTISPAGGVTLNNSTTIAQNGTVSIRKLDTNTWVMVSAPAPGLPFIASASLSGSSVSITSCFSATYNVYRLVIERAYVAAGAPALALRLRVGGSDAATNYNRQEALASSTSWSLGRATGATSFAAATVNTTEASTPIIVDIFSPFIAVATGFIVTAMYEGAQTTPGIYLTGGSHTTATSYDSLTIFPGSSTFSGGTARIYGYRNS